MSRIAFMTAAAVATLTFAGAAVAATPVCSARNDILAKLANAYHEQPASVALTSDGHLLEVLKSDNAKTWSILLTAPNGVSCLVAAGESWQDKDQDNTANSSSSNM
jgi:hypothetical protein